jgi:ABC-type bacteriocin/lantibiotic exporter with double-glycine peptidase domain
MVGFLDQDKRPVALLPGRRGYQLDDPGTRAKALVDEELASQLHGFAYVFYRPFPAKALTLRDILDDAWVAARLAGLEEGLKTMPMGMHTVVSEGGGGLSGGQRQRLLIARAIVHKPRIILFDEATSALDNRTQAIVSQSLKALNATRVVIAHRLSTVMRADRIYVLDKGSLVESGSYDELMAQAGLFTQMAKRQLS